MDLKAHYARHRRAITKTLSVMRSSEQRDPIAPTVKTIVLAMKFTAIILLSACLTASATGYSQKVTLSEKNARLENVFKVVREQTGYEFLFTYEMLKKAAPVTLDLKSVELEDALAAMFKGQPLTYRIIEKTVVVKPKAEEPKENLPPPFTDVKGRLVNENGEPVVGATVTIKGTKIATSTNANGEFKLSGLDPNATLVFSSTNIEPIEVKLNGRTDLNLVTKTRISKLDEVQIIGYGTTTQRFNVGSVTKVTSEEISKQPVGNPLLALQGRVAGLVINQTSGLPGAGVKIQIRGQNTLPPTTSGTPPLDNPLYIIDGVPFSPANVNINQLSSIATDRSSLYGNLYGGLSPFNSINPSDIESIEVLRDADATAIYGSRGANGVILITTKRGKAGDIKVTANVYSAMSNITRTMDLMDTKEYVAARKEALRNDGVTTLNLSNAPDLVAFDTTKYTDWKKFFLGKTSHVIDANTNISGGNANTQFLIGTGYRKESYIFPGDFADKRFSMNANIHHTSQSKRFEVGLSSNYSYNVNNSSGSSNALSAFMTIPNHPDFLDENGNLRWNYNGVDIQQNPLANLKRSYKISTHNLISNLKIRYSITKNISFNSSIGFNSMNVSEIALTPKAAQNPANNPRGSATFAASDYKGLIIEPQLNYSEKIWKGRFSALLGFTYEKRSSIQSSIDGSGYNNDNLLESLAAATTVRVISASNVQYKYASAYGRINYIVENRYILSLNGRSDQSSRFGPGRRKGNFGSVAAGWIFSEEDFMKKAIPSLSYGKVKASYGTTGSDAIGDFQYLSTWIPLTSSLLYQGTNGYRPANLYNPDYSWATTKKLELGIEVGLWSDKLLASVNWYQNRCGNQLINYTLPNQAGFGGVTQNFPATVQNSGWEMTVSSKLISNKNFYWNTSAVLSIPKNKLLAFPDLDKSSYASTYIIGEPLSVVRGYHYLGVNATTGVFEFASHNGPTSSPSYSEREIIARPDPKFYGSWINSFAYKGFELSMLFQFSKQIGTNYMAVYSFLPGTENYNMPKVLLDRWQKPGDVNVQHQRYQTYWSSSLNALYATYPLFTSDGFYSDASYVRLKTLSLSYAFRPSVMRKMKMDGLRLFMNTQNVLTITNYKGNDPETLSFYNVPPLRTVSAGIQLSF